MTEATNQLDGRSEAIILFIRNAEAPQHASNFGRLESLVPDITPTGTQQAVGMGRQIRRILNEDFTRINEVMCANSKRSRSTAIALMGGAGFPNVVKPTDRLDHTGIQTADVRERITRWALDLESGLYVAALSRRALAILIADKYGWNEEIIDSDPGFGQEGYIPTASLTQVRVINHRELVVNSLGIDASQLEAREPTK